MGWITTHRDKGQSHQAFFRAQGLFAEYHEVLVESTVKSVYYAAVRDNRTAEVFGLVILIQRAPNSYHNFGWKDMDETMGPNEAQAPAKVLDALTETTNEYALQWRAACRNNLVVKERKLDKGAVIKLAEPLTFWVGGTKVKATEFTYAPQPRKLNIFSIYAEELGSRLLVSLPDWRRYAFEIV